jgi:hypothetical protein
VPDAEHGAAADSRPPCGRPLAAELSDVGRGKACDSVTTAVRKSLLIVALFGISAYCACGVLAVAQLAPYPAPRSSFVAFYLFAAGFLVFFGVAIWQLVSLLKRHGSENLL